MILKPSLVSLALSACVLSAPGVQADTSETHPHAAVEQSTFGTLPDGRTATLYRIVNDQGMAMTVTDYGGIITSLDVPDRRGTLEDVVLGFDSLSNYLSTAYQRANPYFGAVIGRYGNRIAGGQFEIDGHTYTLAKNDGPNHLHGGDTGFSRVLWHATPFDNAEGSGVVLTYTSPDGDGGYPGQLATTVTYTLTDANQLVIDYRATTTKTTPVNLTQHSYFNLNGEGSGSVLDHQLMINADAFTPVDATLIPTGDITPVQGTPFDFTEPMAIGARIDQNTTQLERGKGYDHNFVLKRAADGNAMRLAARVIAPDSGRVMEVSTTEPGIQFYSGNFLDGTLTGKSGRPYGHRSGFALETQHYPDSPNQSAFPSTLLSPGDTYRSRTVYSFSTQ
ncbi:aldose epimerase family protein [Larsenimonas suaedae]|uniref:Aldose 1-epimerase n=1 Tax=Larsenimonas suaedae TaxID=1851019 RepID=A0ABU1GTD0_9GAMM|nr:aldose epimerase family protein [Larsenimonas suaedae]MCM2972546.1 galactose mutarotase [Larsenimonas suaedae]MDR5894658.1 galactose mutarotase [Larsenimonas suaedae]